MIDASATGCAMHLLTFDVEHWYEGLRHRGLSGWEGYPPRDPIIINRLLALLSEEKQLATWFMTGVFAQEFPGVARAIVEAGHEIASHGFDHVTLPRLGTRFRFREDLSRSIGVIENITGQQIQGFRAPKWSITEEVRSWAHDEIFRAGLIYDSSLFPRLFACNALLWPHRITTESGGLLWEIPASIFSIGMVKLPAAGGLFLRSLPAVVTRMALAQAASNDRPGMVYLHPYDLDPKCPNPGGSILFRASRSIGVHRTWPILQGLVSQYRFTTIREWLRWQAGERTAAC